MGIKSVKGHGVEFRRFFSFVRGREVTYYVELEQMPARLA